MVWEWFSDWFGEMGMVRPPVFGMVPGLERRLQVLRQERVSTDPQRADRLPHVSVSEPRGNRRQLRRGVHNVRWFEFQGNHRLLLIPREDGKGGVIDRKNATNKLLWERIK